MNRTMTRDGRNANTRHRLRARTSSEDEMLYVVALAWMYVVLMVALAEAFSA